jgi:hypothetical protein
MDWERIEGDWARLKGSAKRNWDKLTDVQCEVCHGPGSLHVALLRLRMLPAPAPNWHSPGAMWFLQVFPFVIYGSALASIPMFIRSGNSGKPGRRASSPG